jgi:hypothetical protein
MTVSAKRERSRRCVGRIACLICNERMPFTALTAPLVGFQLPQLDSSRWGEVSGG